ncbi:uncharacterized protein BJ212DRAFT_1295150 [Suillus subaureus]|uniref:Uncharacterized protein n=1 Tax=Suillus subaureus TaxID=48587 RepID=A0A9P7JIX5_9AGAM|nr:uncharacterized protein BJ212DRAFT_1295150 [Suillus subaureus]KAG1825788.1 hypothetical protein BJ212DRAFT_1295150 [Suillus subaureus]
MSSVKYRENQEGGDITGKPGSQEGEDITGKRGNQEGEDIIGKQGSREGGDIIGKQGEEEDITRNDYLGRILEYQIPFGGARNLSFPCVVSDNIHHILSGLTVTIAGHAVSARIGGGVSQSPRTCKMHSAPVVLVSVAMMLSVVGANASPIGDASIENLGRGIGVEARIGCTVKTCTVQ